jgi:hypothetical protein
MLTSVPPGAAVFINDRKWPENTPAQIGLAPGTYTVAVERDGKRVSERVQIRNGTTTYLRMPIQP